jgi:hypothetical protein
VREVQRLFNRDEIFVAFISSGLNIGRSACPVEPFLLFNRGAADLTKGDLYSKPDLI